MPGRGPHRRLTVARRPPTPRPVLVLEQPDPPNPKPVPTSLQEQRPSLPPSRSLHPPGVPQAAPGPLPHRSQLAALPPPLQTHPSPGRAAGPGGVGCVTRMRTRPFARAHLCERPRGERTLSTHLCERSESVRFPDGGSAPGSSARAPTTSGGSLPRVPCSWRERELRGRPRPRARVHLAVPARRLGLGGSAGRGCG